MIEKGTYKLKEEFFKKLNIPLSSYDRRREDLLEWLKNFFDYEIIGGKPISIKIKEVYGEYQKMPRKVPDQKALNEEKEAAYRDFTLASLGEEFKPNSRDRVARTAIEEFGKARFGHENAEAVAKRFVGPAFAQYSETNHKRVWVYFSNYEELEEFVLLRWREVLREERIGVEEAAAAFYKSEMGEDIMKEKDYFRRAREKFKEEFGDIAVLVGEYRRNRR